MGGGEQSLPPLNTMDTTTRRLRQCSSAPFLRLLPTSITYISIICVNTFLIIYYGQFQGYGLARIQSQIQAGAGEKKVVPYILKCCINLIHLVTVPQSSSRGVGGQIQWNVYFDH